jgi:hypothetical protein
MRLLSGCTAAIALALTLAAPAHAAGTKATEPFDQHGVIVDIHQFFTAATAGADLPQVEHATVAGQALVTEAGVFAFLETPHNDSLLAGTGHGTVVRVTGTLLPDGALLHLASVTKQTTVPLIDFASLRGGAGLPAELEGVNKCQCGLDVGALPHSCQLGHLHHLEATDGRIYHYLQFARGQDFFLGKGSHFKAVRVKARVLPGNYLVVESAEVDES